MDRFATIDGAPVFRLVSYNDGLFDVTDGFKMTLNGTPLLNHDEAIDFILKYALDFDLKNVRYTLVETKREV